MSRPPGTPATKQCSNCGRGVFSMLRGDITVIAPARVERIEATGNVTAHCRCGRRVVWFRSKKPAQVTVTAG